jgi:nicotinate-nucleotide pyrophosphorylase (carboxylating)
MNIIEYMISEDLGFGDITSEILIPKDKIVKGKIISKDKGIVAGVQIIKTILDERNIKVNVLIEDGLEIDEKDVILEFEGNAQSILSLERTCLNLMMRMSGIATMTSKIIAKVRTINDKIIIAGTRKTSPGIGNFDKIAITIGGGDSHRLRLDDLILIKDNHIAIVGSVPKSIEKAQKKASFAKKIEIEVNNTEDAIKATKSKVDIIMLDNMSPNEIEKTIKALIDLNLRDNIIIEASGKITKDNILDYAKTNVDVISLGFITHSAPSLDLSLKIAI